MHLTISSAAMILRSESSSIDDSLRSVHQTLLSSIAFVRWRRPEDALPPPSAPPGVCCTQPTFRPALKFARNDRKLFIY